MYYEEKMIDGVLCWRGGQNDEWQPISTESLSRRLLAADSRVAELEGQVEAMRPVVEAVTKALDATVKAPSVFMLSVMVAGFAYRETLAKGASLRGEEVQGE